MTDTLPNLACGRGNGKVSLLAKSDAVLGPRTKQYEFGGPLGALFVTIVSPFIVYALYFSCSEQTGGCPSLHYGTLLTRPGDAIMDLKWWQSLWDTKATLIYLGWYAFCVVSWMVLPGDWIEGTELRTGERKMYKMNANATFWLASAISAGTILRYGASSFTFFYHHWVGFVTASVFVSVVHASYVYAASFEKGKLLALSGNTGNLIHDWFIGRELNPSVGSFDIKSFNELRPGLILWHLVNLSMACEQFIRLGNRITDSMALVLAFQGYYVFDAVLNEPAVLTTMDITTDGLGFMLTFGCLSWIPFTFSLQARYLVFNPIDLGLLKSVAIIGVNLVGLYIFRMSNSEKNNFRNGKNPKNLKYFQTERGTKLLISGWWGTSRHPNYMGDLLMALAWSLPTGFNTPITYFYVIYFTALLVHRQRRDDESCRKKYGKDWDKYMELVPYRIFPYVY